MISRVWATANGIMCEKSDARNREEQGRRALDLLGVWVFCSHTRHTRHARHRHLWPRPTVRLGCRGKRRTKTGLAAGAGRRRLRTGVATARARAARRRQAVLGPPRPGPCRRLGLRPPTHISLRGISTQVLAGGAAAGVPDAFPRRPLLLGRVPRLLVTNRLPAAAVWARIRSTARKLARYKHALWPDRRLSARQCRRQTPSTRPGTNQHSSEHAETQPAGTRYTCTRLLDGRHGMASPLTLLPSRGRRRAARRDGRGPACRLLAARRACRSSRRHGRGKPGTLGIHIPKQHLPKMRGGRGYTGVQSRIKRT